MRRVAIGAIAVAGVGLFGTGVHGLVQVDGKLADAADRPAAHEVKNQFDLRDDCPQRDHRRSESREL